MVERLHRRLLDVIKDEFDRRGRSDVNAVQALLLYNIGDKELTAGELRTRGYYLGSNVSYNVKKLVEVGFLHHSRSRIDRRSVRISLTERGTAFLRHAERVADAMTEAQNSVQEKGGRLRGKAARALGKRFLDGKVGMVRAFGFGRGDELAFLHFVLDALEDLFAMHRDSTRCVDAHAHLIALYTQHRDGDLVTDLGDLIDVAAQMEKACGAGGQSFLDRTS